MEIRRLLYNISALADLGEEAASSSEFPLKMRSVLHVIMGTFLVNKGAVFTAADEEGRLTAIAGKGLEGLNGDLRVDLAEKRMRLNEPFSLLEAWLSPASLTLRASLLSAGAEVFLPLWTRDRFMGAVALGRKFTEEPWSAEDFDLLKAIGHQLAITLHNHDLLTDLAGKAEENRRLYEEMRLIYHDTIQAFAAAIDAKDVYTKDHSTRVARYVVAIAKELGWSEQDVEGIYIAGLLHDVGKIIISDTVLNKRTPLTREDIVEIKKHPHLSYNIISKVKFPWKELVTIVRHHHERPDGRGYPDSLTNGSLSEGAKMLTLADSFDAMTTSRPYKKKLGLATALEEMKRCLNSQFDPHIMAAFCRVLEKEIRSELPEPGILPHLDEDFDPTVITDMLAAIREELSY
ncbi:MAG: HD domain-containing protein [Nitrospirota bacterium]